MKRIISFLIIFSFSGIVHPQSEDEIDKALKEVDRPVRKEVQEEIRAIRGKPEIEIEEKEIKYTVILVDCGRRKISVIRKIRALTDLSFKKARDLAESAPNEVKTGVSREEAENIKKELEEAGAKVEIKIIVEPRAGDEEP